MIARTESGDPTQLEKEDVMKTLSMATVLVATSLAVGASIAQVSFSVPANLPTPMSTLTRADVLADFLVWRASGLHELTHRGESDTDTSSPEYMQAEARYDYLRASPQFPELIDQIKKNGSTRVVIDSRQSALATN